MKKLFYVASAVRLMLHARENNSLLLPLDLDFRVLLFCIYLLLVQTTTEHITDQMLEEAVALQAPSERCSRSHCAERAWCWDAKRRVTCNWGGMFGCSKPPASRQACGFSQNLAFLNVAQIFESYSVSGVVRRF